MVPVLRVHGRDGSTEATIQKRGMVAYTRVATEDMLGNSQSGYI